jgi:Transposase, Mutator family.
VQEPDHRLEDAQFGIAIGPQHLNLTLIARRPGRLCRRRRGDPRPVAGQGEGAKFWLHIMNELWNRGVEDIPFPVVDGLKVFDYCTTIFPVICG